MDVHSFLTTLALVLCVAAVTTVIFQRLRLPVVFGYLLAGMIVGPHIPIPLHVEDAEAIKTLSEIGVILLMFGLGLEFSLRKLIAVGGISALIALAETSAMIWIGYSIGQAFGWTTVESIFTGAIIAISSTTIIIKAFAEQGVKGKVAQIVFGILIIEDLIAIFLLAMLTTVGTGQDLTPGEVAAIAGRLVTFLVGLITVGLLILPRLVRYLVKLNRPETITVASVGISFAAARLALSFGYPVALGAFIAGSLVAESGEEKTVEHLIAPVRDIFAAIFFIAIGMMIDPVVIAEHWRAVAVLTLALIVGKLLAVSISAFLAGYPMRSAVQTGMSLTQIGEFSLIIAGLGLALGATRPFLQPVAIAVSAITTLTTPWLIRASGPVANFVDRKLPHRLQTFVALYGSWMARMRSSAAEEKARSKARRAVQFLLLDVVLLAAVIIGASLEMERVREILSSSIGMSDTVSGYAVLALAVLIALPLIVGAVRSARQLGLLLALRALPSAGDRRVDFAAAPRRVLFVTLQLGILLMAGIPLVAVTQPFLPPLRGAFVLIGIVALLGVAFWRSATNLHGHARAGAELIVSVLAQQMGKVKSTARNDGAAPQAESSVPVVTSDNPTLQDVDTVLPGLGEPRVARIDPACPIVDRTLAEIDLRGQTGATILAIMRAGEPVLVPDGHDFLRAGDLVALAGTEDSVEVALRMLAPPQRST